jgi:hypothetical protein
MGRGALHVRVRAGGRDVELVNCHLMIGSTPADTRRNDALL